MDPKETDVLRQAQWQNRLLPVMSGVLVVLTFFFFIASFVQLFYLNRQIKQSPQLDLSPALNMLESTRENEKNINKLDYAQWKTVSILEGHALQRRYHQTNVGLMARIWRRYMGFVTGMILSLVGATFILGKLREPESKVDAESSLWKFSIATTSPGIILALLGTILMITTILAHPKIEVVDRPVYMGQIGVVPLPPNANTGEILDYVDEKLKNLKTLDKASDDEMKGILEEVEKKLKASKKNK